MHSRTFWRVGLTVLVLFLAAEIFLPMTARADNLELTLQFASTTVSAGGTGSFDVILTDEGGGSGVTIAGFDFELQSSSSDLVLTDANTSTSAAPYIFSTQSLFGPDITIQTTPELIADDIAGSGGTTLTAGDTIALGEVLFDVSATAPTEMVNIQFDIGPSDVTDLSDPNENNVPISSATGGTVDIIGTKVPEPSTLMMLLSVIPFALLIGLRTRHKFEG